MSEPLSKKWVPVKGYEGLYLISKEGKIFGLKRNVFIRTEFNQRYFQATLSKNNQQKSHTVHSLVLASFVGERPKGLVINHKDGNRKNNHVSNLEYVRQVDNIHHSIRFGLQPIQPRDRNGKFCLNY